ncbi:type I site-specific deoxyribonuclease specificity subunit [Roseburia sp. CAG:100]|nr:type I site-specific deoxyribonuclease specificity subunit [Roseburia sp. CAG:100]
MRSPKIRFKGYSEDWEQRKLGELADKVTEKNGRLQYIETFTNSAEFGIISQRDFFDHDIAKIGSLDGYYIVRNEDFVYNPRISTSAPVGPINRNKLGRIGVMSPLYTVFRPHDVDTTYLEHFFKSKYWHSFMNYNGDSGARSDRFSIKDSVFFEMPITIPQIEEQRKIGEHLTQLDRLITLHQRKCEQTQKLKKYMLQKMFPQDKTNVPKIRFDGFTDAWEQRKLSEIATMHARIGWQNLRTSEFLDDGDYMLITGTDFEDGRINFSTCHYVEKERYDQDRNIQISDGSILITKDGTLGKVAYVQGLKKPATLNAGVFNVQIRKENNVDGKYLFQYLKAPFLMDYVGQKATGGTIKHLNQNILVDFPVVMPKIEEQERLGAYFEQLDLLITLHQQKCDQLQSIKKYMLQNMFV